MKKVYSAIAVHLIIALTLTLLFVLIPFDKQAVSWIAYAFAMVALVGNLAIDWVAFRNAKTLKSKLYGFPIFRLGIIYVCTQLAVSIVFIVVGAFVKVPFWASLLASLLLVALTAIGTIVGDNLHDTLEHIEEKGADSTKRFVALQNRALDINDKCVNSDLKDIMQELVEKFKYGDPVSSDATKEIEDDIAEQLAILDGLVAAGDAEKAIESIKAILNLLSSRSRLCKSGK